MICKLSILVLYGPTVSTKTVTYNMPSCQFETMTNMGIRQLTFVFNTIVKRKKVFSGAFWDFCGPPSLLWATYTLTELLDTTAY